jgi:hypothetical protein
MMVEAAGSRRPLRFGLLCDGKQLRRWQIDCVSALEDTGNAHASLLIVDDRSTAMPRSSLLWRLYGKALLDHSPLARLLPLPEQLAALPVISAERRSEDVQSHELDFILDFSAHEPSAALHSGARRGVWAFRFGNQVKEDQAPPGFWDCLQGATTTGAELVRLSDQPGLLERLWSGVFKADAAFFGRLTDKILRNALASPARVSRTWKDGDNAPPVQVFMPSPPPRPGPSNRDTIRFVFKQANGLLTKVARRLFRHQLWRVGIIDAPVQEVTGLTDAARASPPVRWLPNPAERFLADPFAIETEGGLLLLAEDYRWTTARGMISGVRLSDTQVSEPRTVFDLPVHMSYPYLLRHERQLYCVPETNEAREVALYALDEQSLEWSKVEVLVGGRRLADSTIFEWNGRWWLLATDVEDDQVLNLHAWHAPSLTGPWEEHAANPVKTDVRSSRPAGRPFVHEGRLYRPAQDCSDVYGGAVTINRVVELTPTHFLEETAAMVHPHQDWPARDGLHHLCGVGDLTVIDACEEVFVWRATASAVLRKFSRFRRAPSRGSSQLRRSDVPLA